MGFGIQNWIARAVISALVFLLVLGLVAPHFMDVQPPWIVRILLAPTWFLAPLVGKFLPAGNIGTAGNPIYELTPVHVLMAFVIATLNVLLYPVVTYFVLSFCSRAQRQRELFRTGLR